MSASGGEPGRAVREAKAELAGLLGTGDSEGVIDTSIFMDPTLIHIYDGIADPAVRAEVMRAITGDAEALLIQKLQAYGSPLVDAVSKITGVAPTGGGHDAPGGHGGGQVDAKPYQERIDAALKKIGEITARTDLGQPAKDQLVREQAQIIVHEQMVLNALTPGAYITAGSVKVTVTVKEMIRSPRYQELKTQAKSLAKRLTEGSALATDARVKIENEWKATLAEMKHLKDEAMRTLTGDEAYQSVIGDIDFFEHMVTEARAEALKALEKETAGLPSAQAKTVIEGLIEDRTLEETAKRYEASKYADRVLEIAEMFGMNPMTASHGRQ